MLIASKVVSADGAVVSDGAGQDVGRDLLVCVGGVDGEHGDPIICLSFDVLTHCNGLDQEFAWREDATATRLETAFGKRR